MIKSVEHWATWAEIHRQPEIWSAWGKVLDVDGLRGWIGSLGHDEVWFCGAGTSAYIGDIIAAGVPGMRAVPSTDIVATPKAFLNGVKPLVVSFGRSGNSTESIGTLDALDALAPGAARLHITCNKDGALATRGSHGPLKVIVLPDATHDAGFAMTSSFSTMLLTALALFDAPCDVPARMDALAGQMAALLPKLRGMPCPERAVYVGSGPLSFAAREAALKVMELSAGQIPALWDSTLGFRHGPKSFVTADTAVTVFTSPDAPTRDYDADLVAELRAQFPSARVTSVGPGGDIDIPMPFGPTWAAPLCVALAQVTGVEWAGALGLNVDDPFSGQGTLSRVVSGVKLYPVAS
ncbi:tagatose-6-phosphate ketose/aldose isomerase [Aliiroseovarius sediminilitoris]|uniref:Tagatose-6-phosphate ketose/aldose isomerase n=1 Tax=Aliiroseovarius sediminilitoris TaxID=1173584 RepID=A0A1I0PE96_9RHOB|nr:tagatose-bisphosphate aldolase [Aliiroseovarius sediminilitoris]SEW12748.1 tagatose-6-phosphate ketose/aldose isomerase [Aliiroseovarius sediminilitoris]